MTTKQALQKLVHTDDTRLAGRISDYLRFKVGLNYDDSLKMIQNVCPEMTPARWDELMYLVDCGY